MKIRSPRHMRYIAGLSCLINGFWDETGIGHHLLRAGGKAAGTKGCDSLAVPMSHFNHQMLHANGNEVAFFANHGWDYLRLLWWLKATNELSPDKKIREATAVDEAIAFYERLRGYENI